MKRLDEKFFAVADAIQPRRGFALVVKIFVRME